MHPHKTESARRHFCERRGSKRLLCSDLVQIAWVDNSGRRHSEIAILENLSSSGAGLFCGVRVPAGSAIELLCGAATLGGRVQHCEFRENGFLVGVVLSSGPKWPGKPGDEFYPEHLLDVSLLDFE